MRLLPRNTYEQYVVFMFCISILVYSYFLKCPAHNCDSDANIIVSFLVFVLRTHNAYKKASLKL